MIDRQPNRLVVMSTTRVLAPAVVGPDRADRQCGARPLGAIGAPPKPVQPEAAPRRAAVTFALVGLDAAAAERDRQRQRSRDQPAARTMARLCPHQYGS